MNKLLRTTWTMSLTGLMAASGLLFSAGAAASEPLLGQVKMFAGNFAPRGYALCDGQLLPVSQNDALFSLYGTIYGGDGRTTFALPDCRGRVILHQGTGPGLTPRPIGQRGGAETVIITVNTMPSHSHTVKATTATGDELIPTDTLLALDPGEDQYGTSAPTVTMNAGMVMNSTGASQSHTNIMPYQAINHIVALLGVYPSRN